MYGIVIQENHCPRCTNLRTARLVGSNDSFCFNCHLRWNGWNQLAKTLSPQRTVAGTPR
jgi:hypothetical protein